jgi:galactokinase
MEVSVPAITLVEPDALPAQCQTVRNRFVQTYGTAPQLIAHAPGRVNLIGDHVDYNGGACLPIAIPYGTNAAISARSDDQLTIASRGRSNVFHGRLSTLRPDQLPGWWGYTAGVIWCLREAGFALGGVDLVLDGRVPPGSGLSSSASVECAVASAVLLSAGYELNEEVRNQIVKACIRAENEVAGAPTGGMDQTVAMFAQPGHALLIDFALDTKHQVNWPVEADGISLLVIDTTVSHSLADGNYAKRRAECDQAAALLEVAKLGELGGWNEELAQSLSATPILAGRARHVVTEISRVKAVSAALENRDWQSVGEAMFGSHISLASDFDVSCPELDLLVEVARGVGALGARMTGGGFGGSSVILIKEAAIPELLGKIGETFELHNFARPRAFRATASRSAYPIWRN